MNITPKILLLSWLFTFSCKKNDILEKESLCKSNSLVGKYQITKAEWLSYQPEIGDIPIKLNDCELSGIYEFKKDSTTVYTEMEGCMGKGQGTWSLKSGNFFTRTISGSGSLINFCFISKWDCPILTLETRFPDNAPNNRITLVKI